MIRAMTSRGELEQRVLEVLWASSAARSVADVQEELSGERTLAYTTVMTVLDRLAKKHLVTRERVERAWFYTAAFTQAELLAKELTALVNDVAPATRIEALQAFAQELSAPERATLAGS